MEHEEYRIAYNQLSDKEQKIYVKTEAAIKRYEKYLLLEVPPTIMNRIFKAVLMDCPEIFWFEGKWKKAVFHQYDIAIPVYTMNPYEIDHAERVIDTKIRELCVWRNLDAYTRSKNVYMWMIENINYGMKQSMGQTIYDALVDQTAVCKGIAKTYQMILRELEVLSTLKEGSIDGKTKHVWNQVHMDGQWYNVDVCMGYDLFSYMFHEREKRNVLRGFALSDSYISQNYHMR